MFVEDDDSWECVWARELGHDEAADYIAAQVSTDQLDVLVYETFRLRADLAKSQTGSQMETSQLIGVIRFISRVYNLKRARLGLPELKLATSEPSNQKPTAAILRSKGVASEAKGNAHAKSAELAGWYWIMRYGLDAWNE